MLKRTALALLVAALTAVAPAHADTDNWGVDTDPYFDFLARKGFLVNARTKDYLIQLARIVCNLEDQGFSGDAIDNFQE